ncbi:MAG: amino acid adenylation domain-containing protein, partial [Tumebacillaceae bacterium]
AAETMVGLSVERSLEMVVGMLGILKAGGVYVPLDPAYPQERLAFMLEDSQVRVLLTQKQLLGGVLDQVENVVCLDADWETIAATVEHVDNPSCDIDAEHLAYVVYTSGSTGKPKGVCVTHRAVNRLVCNSNYVQLTPADRVAQVSNTSFDAATFEIGGALLSGARLVGITKDIALSPQAFATELKQQGITAIFLTTALFNQIAGVAPDAFSTLKHLMFGGEAVDLRWVREVQKHGAPERLLHVYGPTESTTFTTYHEVGEIAETATTIPIGRPLSNTAVYVLDRHLQPVPVGVPGELHIGGDGLARAYLNRAELTAEKFISHPFATQAGERLYKTGDLVKYLPDGNIEFVGRIDNQVKVRGFRIELGEIENVLQQHADVQESVVVVREDVPGDKRLTAYVVPKPAGQLQMQELRHFVKAQLPEYMVPALFMELAALPLTPNGKVDRRALPSPTGSRPELENEYVAPRNEIERTILAVWQEALGVEKVGMTDNFFDLGGHSILVIKVHSKLQEVLQRTFSIIQLFKYPTIDALTRFLNEERTEQPTYQAAHARARGKQDVINRRKQMQKDRGKISE